MEGPRSFLFISVVLYLVFRKPNSDSFLSPSPSFSLQLDDVLNDDNPLEDETLVADKLCESVNPADVQKLLADVENQQWFSETFIDRENSADKDERGSGCLQFGALDDKILAEIQNGGKDRSLKQTNWTRRKFDSWRKFRKYDISKPIEDLPLLTLNEMLVEFLLQARKLDGKMYPPGSLNCLLKAIGRIVRKKQESRINTTGERVRSNILRDELFAKARLKKAQAISYNSEKDLLADLDFQINTPKCLQKRLCFYLCSRFAIRGAQELCDVQDIDLTLEIDGTSEYIMYNERTSKTYSTTVTQFDDSHFRPGIWSYEPDFFLIYKQYVRHLPPKDSSDPRSLFLQPIANYKGAVWYQRTRIGPNNVSKWIKSMGEILDLDICNKSGRVSAVTRMSMGLVPAHIGKFVTGHRTTEAYQKYDRSVEMQINGAMSINSKPYNDDGTLRVFSDVLDEMMKKNENKLLGSHSSKCLTSSENHETDISNVADVSNVASNASDSSLPAVTNPVAISAELPPKVSAISNSAIQTVVQEPEKENVCTFFNESDLIGYAEFEKFVKGNLALEKYFPSNVEIQNYHGQFAGASFSNCTIQFQLPHSSSS